MNSDKDQAEYRRNLGDRIAESVDKMPSKAAAALVVDVTVEQLNKWIKGQVKVPADALRALSEAANVDFSWLVTGESPSPRKDRPEIADLVLIPRFKEVMVSAGNGSVAVSEQQGSPMAFSHRWLHDMGINEDRAAILFASGDSMYPTIPDGSAMLVDTSKKDVRNGCIYVFDVEGDLLVKRIEKMFDGTVNLISDNQSLYPVRSITIDRLERLTIIGRVYAAVRNL